MIFLTFAHQSGHHLGLVVGDKVLDLTAAWPTGGAAPRDVGLPQLVNALVKWLEG